MFGELRSALHAEPSRAAWERVCDLVSEWDGRRAPIEGALEYALSYLEAWPDRLRTTPIRWRDGMVRGALVPFAPLVRVLDASSMGLRNEDLATLANAPALDHVTALDLSRNDFGWRGLRHLMARARAGQITSLSLAHTGVGNDGVRLIADSPEFGALEHLDLSGLGPSAEAIGALARSSNLAALRSLTLAESALKERHLDALVEGPLWARIEAIGLARNPLGARGVIRLCRANSRPAAGALDLRGCGMSAPAAAMIARSRPWRELTSLRLGGLDSGSMLGALAGPGALAALAELDLDGITDPRSIASLLGPGRLVGLRRLGLEPGAVSATVERAAAARSIAIGRPRADERFGPLGDRRSEGRRVASLGRLRRSM